MSSPPVRAGVEEFPDYCERRERMEGARRGWAEREAGS